MQKNLFLKKKTNCLQLYFSSNHFFFNPLFYNLYLVRKVKSFSYLFFSHSIFSKLVRYGLLFFLKRNHQINSNKNLKIKRSYSHFNFFQTLKKKKSFFFICLKRMLFSKNSLKKDNKNRLANQIKKMSPQFIHCTNQTGDFKFKEIFNNLFIINPIHKISQNHLNEHLNLYLTNLQKLDVKFFNQDSLRFQRKKIWYTNYLFKNRRKSTLIFYFKNCPNLDNPSYFFFYKNYFFRGFVQSQQKVQTYVKTLANLKKIKDYFLKFLIIRFKYLAIKSQFLFLKRYFFLIPSIPFLNFQIYQFIYFLQSFHDISNFLSLTSIKKNKSSQYTKLNVDFFFCCGADNFILKIKKTKFLMNSNKTKIAQSPNNFRNYTKKSKYLTTEQICYNNKDFQNLDFYSIFFKNKKRRKKIYSFIKFFFLEIKDVLLPNKQMHNYPFIFSFKYLDNLLFTFLFNWAKNQHKNNKNFWIFTNYWLFIQPFPYFYSNQTYYNSCPTNQKYQKIYLTDNQTLLNYKLIKKLKKTLCIELTRSLISKNAQKIRIQYKIFLSPKIKKKISKRIIQQSKIVEKTEIAKIQFKKVFSFLLLICKEENKNKVELAFETQYLKNKKSKNLLAEFDTGGYRRQKKQHQLTTKIKNQTLNKNLKTYYLDKYRLFFFPVKRNIKRKKTTDRIRKKNLKELSFATKLIIFKKILLDNFKTISLSIYLKNEEFSF